jgi:hypothetical protein
MDVKLGRLLTSHLADLRRSGLSDRQIVRCGFHSLEAPASIKKALRWKVYNVTDGHGSCLAIPFVDINGKATDFVRLKPDRPRQDKEGKPIRYESPKGLGTRAFFPPDTLPVLKDPTIPLLITEGEKKAAKADREGFPCVGLVGVYGWQRKRAKDKDGKPVGNRELISDLAAIAWQGRLVYLTYDSDLAKNDHVRWAEWHLAECLERHGATVRVVRLPDGETKVGLDDFLVAHGADTFRQLLTSALEPAPPPMARESILDPHRLAKIVLRQRQHAEGCTLCFHDDETGTWDNISFTDIGEEEIKAETTRHVKAEFDRINLLQRKEQHHG